MNFIAGFLVSGIDLLTCALIYRCLTSGGHLEKMSLSTLRYLTIILLFKIIFNKYRNTVSLNRPSANCAIDFVCAKMSLRKFPPNYFQELEHYHDPQNRILKDLFK